MGLITKEVIMRWNSSNKNVFMTKGYLYTKYNDEFLVKVEDLSKGSHAKVDIECDGCGRTLKNINQVFINQKKILKDNRSMTNAKKNMHKIII